MRGVLVASLFVIASTLVSSSPLTINFDLSSIAGSSSKREGGSVIDVLRGDGRFKKLVKALEENKNLRDDLERGDRKITLFAPTDEAWDYAEEGLSGGESNRCARSLDSRRRRGGRGGRRDDDDDDEDDEDDSDSDFDDDNRRRRGGRRNRGGRRGRGGKGRKNRDRRVANTKEGRRGRREDEDEEERDLHDILMYHVVREELNYDDMYEGMLLSTGLKEDELEGKRQKLRVSEWFGNFYLNMVARVHHDEMKADNGYIYAIDQVLCPPENVVESMSNVPIMFSSTLVALEKTGLLDKLEDKESAITVFAPDNAAWKRIGMQNMFYLFSPHGRKDLKHIMQYHVAEEVLYTTTMMKEEKIRVRTCLKDEELEIKATQRGSSDRDRMRVQDDDSKFELSKGKSHHHDKMPANWVFAINKGEARVAECSDVLAENGVIHPINSVLIPPDVHLPFAMDLEVQ